jgi:hypothetical protein
MREAESTSCGMICRCIRLLYHATPVLAGVRTATSAWSRTRGKGRGERAKEMKKASGIMPGVFLIFGEVQHYGPEEPKKNAPGATAQGMSELDSLLSRVHHNSVDAR